MNTSTNLSDIKHYMLFQGMDPGQHDDMQPSTSTSTSTSTDAAAGPESPVNKPPTYDDSMGTVEPSYAAHFCAAEPEHVQFDMRRNICRSSMSCRTVPSAAVLGTMPMQPQTAASTATRCPLPPGVVLNRTSMPKWRTFFNLAPQPKLGPHASIIMCPACGHHGLTRLSKVWKKRPQKCSMWLYTFGWCCDACLLPYMYNGWHTINHYCRACGFFLGDYQPKICS